MGIQQHPNLLFFFTGGLADGSERMRIDGNGTVAINTTFPNTSTKLDVNGSVKLGSSGTVLSGIIKTTGSLSSTVAVPTAGSVNGTITVSGANTNASVIINPRTALPSELVLLMPVLALQIRLQLIS